VIRLDAEPLVAIRTQPISVVDEKALSESDTDPEPRLRVTTSKIAALR
jgi:hypothetical protein